ncbi:HET-domain-containing protein [Lophiostoma macrostomum CBS 122681]|uniref:HET-domain-containing protein n=1 Tax=Lophiostoma macrostomum CBS 122681 TaxID=1314788 RepID=A0A6A6SZR3_9PLEO|nr:HET-domain-containing protein [Lophiostoma macrostomum CBS 122681]
MRLLESSSKAELSWTKDFITDDDLPPYAILSHTWEEDQEVTYEDMLAYKGNRKNGYQKILFCAHQAHRDGLNYFWVDTCCINKSSSAELLEVINSMFFWY